MDSPKRAVPPPADCADLTGCGDHSCCIQKPRGMGTNGGCRCPAWKLQYLITRQRLRLQEYETLLTQLTSSVSDPDAHPLNKDPALAQPSPGTESDPSLDQQLRLARLQVVALERRLEDREVELEEVKRQLAQERQQAAANLDQISRLTTELDRLRQQPILNRSEDCT